MPPPPGNHIKTLLALAAPIALGQLDKRARRMMVEDVAGTRKNEDMSLVDLLALAALAAKRPK